MDGEIRRLRADARRFAQGKPRTHVRYPDAFRRAVVAVARRDAGQRSVTRLARELGVSEPTLTKWLRRPASTPAAAAGRGDDGAGRRDAAEGAGVVLITRTGVRVEGLDRDGLLAVLRALA